MNRARLQSVLFSLLSLAPFELLDLLLLALQLIFKLSGLLAHLDDLEVQVCDYLLKCLELMG